MLFLGFLSTSLGLSQLDPGWWQNASIGTGLLMVGWGAWLGLLEIWRIVRRRRLRAQLQPVLADRARYLAGLPEWPKPQRLTVLLTADALVLDDDRHSLRVPLAAFRQALPPDPATGEKRPWLVARNEYRTPKDAEERLSLEFLDAAGLPRRVDLAHFRRTSPAAWKAAIAAECRTAAAHGREAIVEDASVART